MCLRKPTRCLNVTNAVFLCCVLACLFEYLHIQYNPGVINQIDWLHQAQRKFGMSQQ